MTSIFDIQYTDQETDATLEQTIVEAWQQGQLLPCILDHPTLGPYALGLLDQDFYAYADSIASHHLAYDGTELDTIDLVPMLYAVVARKARKKRIPFQYDDSFYDYIEDLSDDDLVLTVNGLDCLGSLKFERDDILVYNILGPYLMAYTRQNQEHLTASVRQHGHSWDMNYDPAFSDFTDGYLHTLETFEYSRTSSPMFWLIVFNNNLHLDSKSVLYDMKLSYATGHLVSKVLDFVTCSIVGLIPYSDKLNLSIDAVIRGMVACGLSCDYIMRRSARDLPRDQAVEVIVPLSRVCGLNFMFNRLRQLSSTITIPRVKLQQEYEQ